MYDTCLGNPCKPGEICEGTNDGGVVCVKEYEGKTSCLSCFYKRSKGIKFFSSI